MRDKIALYMSTIATIISYTAFIVFLIDKSRNPAPYFFLFLINGFLAVLAFDRVEEVKKWRR